jgi:hypothetical protein
MILPVQRRETSDEGGGNMSKGRKFHQTPLGNILCAIIGVGIAAVVVFIVLGK